MLINFLQVFIFITNTDFDPPKRLIILSHENKSYPTQLSTASVFMQQIPTNFQFDSEVSITTPLSVKVFRNKHSLNIEDLESQPQKLELKSYHNMRSEADFLLNRNIHPNHRYDARRQAEEINEPRPFQYILRGTPPTAFQRTQRNSSSYPSYPQIPKEYVGTVNNIQDILRQVSDKDNDYQESNGMHKIKISGTYKHRKVDDITTMFESSPRKHRGKIVIDEPVVQSHSVDSNKVFGDPFYKYKPNSLSDVNLMATNQFRFAPYNILSNKYVPMDPSQGLSMDPGNLYHQVIIANQNRLKYADDNSKGDNIQAKQKPFTLMLDVYPMPEDEHITSTTPMPVKYHNHFHPNMMRHPGIIGSINNLQPFYHNSQLKTSRYPNLPHYHNPNYFRKFGARPLNTEFYSSSNDRDSGGNNPSQITVHLNLFPKKKERFDHANRNGEILNKDDPTSISNRLQERMAKLGNKVNQTENENELNNKESTNLGNISNKVDMDVLQTTTVSSMKQSVIVVDESANDFDSTEDIFSKEFLQYQSTESPTDSTTFESKSVDNSQPNLVPTILPIEPRVFSRHLGKSLTTKMVH